jgi:hypothetical protein
MTVRECDVNFAPNAAKLLKNPKNGFQEGTREALADTGLLYP